jgi:hypothetical protein
VGTPADRAIRRTPPASVKKIANRNGERRRSLLYPSIFYPLLLLPPAMSTRLISDDALLAQCRWDQFRGSGPGGQKRNKTSNAVRLTHGPTGISATATESRSLSENKLYALRRLKLKLAADLREPVDLLMFAPPEWFVSIRHENRIAASHRHPLFAAAGGLILDLMAALGGNPAAVAINLGVSTTAVIKLLETEPHLWAAANHIRAEAGLQPLAHRR